MTMPSSKLSLLGLGVFALSVTSCGLITTEVETDVKVSGTVQGTGTTVYDEFEKDLLEIDDYRNNIDKIKNGEVYAFLVKFTRVYDDNAARTVGGRVNVRFAGTDDPYIEGVAQWTPVYLGAADDPDRNQRLNEVYVEPDPDTARRLNDILFNDNPRPIQFQIEAFASEAPVHFDYEVTVFLRIEAGA